MQKQKKTTAGILALLVALPLLFSVFFLVKQNTIRVEAEDQLNTTSLQTITIPLSELHWLNNEKELLIAGKLFDVKSYTFANNTVTLAGLYDNNEDELVQELYTMVDHKNRSESDINDIIFKYLFFPVFTDQSPGINDVSWQMRVVHFARYVGIIPTPVSSVISPPPKIV